MENRASPTAKIEFELLRLNQLFLIGGALQCHWKGVNWPKAWTVRTWRFAELPQGMIRFAAWNRLA